MSKKLRSQRLTSTSYFLVDVKGMGYLGKGSTHFGLQERAKPFWPKGPFELL